MNLTINNFRIINNLNINFHKNIYFIYGNNASGKTSIIEAIYYLGTTKSFRTSNVYELIKQNKEFLRINLILNKNEYQIVLTKTSKFISINRKEIKKLSEYLGLLQIVVFTTSDLNLINGTPADKRSFLDLEISKLNQFYLKELSMYLKLIKKRNAILKKIKINDDYTLLNIVSNELIKPATYIIQKRIEFINLLNESINAIKKEYFEKEIYIKYLPNVSDSNLKKHLFNKIENDILLESTSKGPHKDDFQILINNQNAQYYASNGEQRLIVLIIKLAIFKVIKNEVDNNIVLLLDDCLAELDHKKRVNFLTKLPKNEKIIITSTHQPEVELDFEVMKLRREDE